MYRLDNLFRSNLVRKVVLIVLVLMIFTNWSFYWSFYIFLKESIAHLIQQYTNSDNDFITIFLEKVDGGIAYLLLMIVNILLSMAVVYVYYKGNRRVLVLALKLIVAYCIISGGVMVVLHLFKLQEYALSARFALDLISSPLSEAILIPLLASEYNVNKEQS
jgi:hypothetical protein